MSETRVPAIPAVTPSNLTEVTKAVKQILDVREGLTGDPLDANVTFRDLVNAGIATINLSSGISRGSSPVLPPGSLPNGYDPTKDLTQPPAPEGFTATGAFATVLLQWTAPQYRNHAYTEIWRSDTNVIGNAVLVGTSTTRFYTDSVGTSASNYYWARFVSQANVTGPYNATGGTLGQTATDPSLVLASLSGQIRETHLFNDLKTRIDLIDGPSTLSGSVAARLAEEATARNAAITNATTPITTALNQEISDRAAAITSEASARTSSINSAVNGLQSQIDALSAASSGDVGSLIAIINSEQQIRKSADEAFAAQATLFLTQNAGNTAAIKNEEVTRSTADAATASSLSLLYVRSGDSLAAIQNEAATRATQDGSIASQVTALKASSDSALAGLSLERAVSANQSEALAGQFLALNSSLASNTASIIQEQTTRAAADSASAALTTGLAVSIGNNSASLSEESLTRASSDGLLSTQITTLSALAGTNSASIQQEATARALTDGALSTLIDRLKAETATSNAAIYEEQLARATSVNAVASQITGLTTAFSGNTASINSEASVRSSADSASASVVTGLIAALGSAAAAIQQETSVRVSENSSVASTISTLAASVGTNAAAISQEATVRANADNSLFAQYTVKIDAAGRVAGFGLASESTTAGVNTSAFGINADRFWVSAPADFSQEAQPASTSGNNGKVWYKPSTKQTFRYNHATTTWVAFEPIIPFVVQTSATTINGVSVPAGIYMDAAFIRDGTITNAKIGNLAVDNAKIAAGLDAAKITVGFLSADRIDASSITADKIDTRGLTVKDAQGNVILGSGTLLAASYISPSDGWLNSNVSLTSLGQNTFRVVSAGNFAVAAHPAVGLYKNGTLVYGKSRSYMMARIRRTDGVVTFNQTYDVFGDPANAAALAADLDATGTDSVVVVYTFDEPQINRTSALLTAMYRCGASKGVFGKSTFRYRSAYILIGLANVGEGNGFEAYRGAIDNDTEAYCDVGFVLVNGVPVISGVASKIVIDAANVSTYIAGAAIGNAQIGNRIQSTNFNGAIDEFGAVTNVGSAGWAIDKTGVAVFNNVRVRGDVEATSLNAATGTFSGTLNSVNGVFTGTLQGATGTFTGELLAGTLDLSKLVGTTLTYSSPGTYYATVPAGSTKMRVQVIGAGGGGASSGQSYDEGYAHGPGGGGGGVSIATYDVVAGNTYSVAVGAGGAGGAGRSSNGNGNSGSPGGNSQIVGPGVNLVAYGGGGATAPNYRGIGAAVGAGGSGVTANGYAGQLYTTEARNVIDPKTGQSLGTENYPVGGGKGGNTGLNIAVGGAGGWGDYYVSPPGNGGVPGAGGGGSGIGYNNRGTYAGGSGGNGRVVVEFYNPNGVVVRSEWVTLIAALQRQNIQTV